MTETERSISRKKKAISSFEKEKVSNWTIIPRPDVTVAQIILLTLSQRGRLSFQNILSSPRTKTIGAQRTENSFYTALSRLKRRHYIIRNEDGTYALTPNGEYAALKAYVRVELTQYEKKLESTGRSIPQKWDGRWRIIFFDIPESRRALRDHMRSLLKRLGCREFQRSMWIYPHKLPDFALQFLRDGQIRHYARVITTYDIDYDEDLRRYFKLQ